MVLYDQNSIGVQGRVGEFDRQDLSYLIDFFQKPVLQRNYPLFIKLLGKFSGINNLDEDYKNALIELTKGLELILQSSDNFSQKKFYARKVYGCVLEEFTKISVNEIEKD